ncbi:MAG TPA: SurA N-terminal domain-containing protein [Caulobacteraceae bacterium]|jgi:peptidyl-prolyl cis-trans isomerase D|nr:SurA N-terminal domain-containing protein [Caulobacteraceae bacterium]
MLAQIRSFAKSPVATILLGLLVVSFAVFGIADVFRNHSVKDAVVEAGARTIGSAQYKQMFDRYKKDVEQQNGGQPVSTEQAVAAGADRGLADSLAQSEAFAALVTKLGVNPSDKLVVGELRKQSAFFDPVSGKFDKQTYETRLQENGLTGAAYEQLLRDQIAQGQLLSGLAAGLTTPRTYMAAIAAYNREGRDVTWFALAPSLAGPLAKPTDADLAAYIKKNAPRFTKPELRQLSFVRFSPAEFAQAVPVPEAEVLKRFNFEKDALSIPETRSFVQVPVKTAAAGANAADLLRKGADPEQVAKSLGVNTVSYADAPKTAVSDRKIADTVFGPVKAGDVIGPTQGALGLAVVKVTKVGAGHQATLDEARAKITGEIQKEGATEKVYQIVQKYEDARSGGANMAEAAQKSGAKVMPYPVPLTAQGTNLQGQPMPIPPKLVQAAFALPQSGDSEVIDLGQGEYAAVRVDKVMKSALAGVDEVRPAASQMLMFETQQKALAAKADALTAAIKKGQTMAQAAASVGATVQTAADVQRSAAGKTFSNDFMQKLFGAKPGEVFVGQDQKLGLVLGRLDKIATGPPAELAAQVEVQRDDFRNVLFNDFTAAARIAARQEIKPTVDYAKARTALGLEALPAGPAGAKK